MYYQENKSLAVRLLFYDFFSSFKNENKNDLKMDSRILNKRAAKNPLTTKPATNLLAKIIMTALITNKKRPKETIVAGKVKKIKSGLTNIFSKAITTATIIAVV